MESGSVRQRNRNQRGSDIGFKLSLKQESTIDLSSESEGSIRFGPNNKESLSNTFTLTSIIVFISLSFLFVTYMDNRLPKPLTIKGSAQEPDRFIEERARNDLIKLTSYGPRVTGSPENEVQAVNLLLELLQTIKDQKNDAHSLEVVLQKPSGEFFMDDDEGHTSTYGKVSNVVAKLEPADVSKRSNNSMLFNCHFDSKPGSPGATDNMISCVTMLEVLRVLSNDSRTYKNTLIFLFNGAEELGMQGAHGFVAGWEGIEYKNGHPWAANLFAAVNLEGAGAGGRPLLFQTGPGDGWILKLYSTAVPRPFGTALAEEAFQMELIPSDTDFRMFRDYGNKVPGLDISFIKNGWVYHTKWDKVQEIPGGSIQHVGDNTLALAQSFGDLDVSGIKWSSEKMIFFDVFGLFMIVYTELVGMILNIFWVLLSLALIIWFDVIKPRKYWSIPWAFGSSILAWGLGLAAAVTIGALSSGFGYYSPFQSYPLLLIILFGLPAILTQIVVYSFTLKGNPELSWLGGKLVLLILLFIGTFFTRAVFLLLINVVFSILVWYLAKALFKDYPKLRVLTYLVVGELIPFNLTIYVMNTLFQVFVPVMARSGPGVNPNVFLSLIAAVICMLAFNGLLSFLVGFRKTKLIGGLLISAVFINSVIVFGYIGKVPYQEKTPMRLNLIDLQRMWFAPDGVTLNKSEYGVLIWPVDPNTENFLPILSETVPELSAYENFDMDMANCEDLYCGAPQMWTASNSYKKVYYLPKSSTLPTEWTENVRVEVSNKVEVSPNTWNITLVFHGPTQISFVLSPGINYKLGQWSLESPPSQGIKWHDNRETYFVFHETGLENTPFEITITLTTSNTPTDKTLLDIHFSTFYLYGVKQFTPEMILFNDKFPSWTYVYSWTSVVQFYKVEI